MNADETPVTKPRFINTPELVVSKDPDDCLGNNTSFYFIQLVPAYFFSYLIRFSTCVCRKKEELTGACE